MNNKCIEAAIGMDNAKSQSGQVVIEVFKTDVRTPEQAKTISRRLRAVLPGAQVNFDLDDIDKILRIKSRSIDRSAVIALLAQFDCLCEVLPD